MVDNWLGRIFDTMDKNNLWENTAVIVTTDHGHELGEKRRFGKQPPHYDLNAHIPLMIWHPSLEGPMRINAFTTAVDIYPTILEILGGDVVQSPYERSLMPLMRGETDTHREAVVYGTFGCGATVTNNEYTYHCGWDDKSELFEYTALMLRTAHDAQAGKFIPGVGCPVWKMPAASQPSFPELLFDRRADRAQEHNISATNPAVVKQMRELLVKLMDEEGVPKEQYRRLGLR